MTNRQFIFASFVLVVETLFCWQPSQAKNTTMRISGVLSFDETEAVVHLNSLSRSHQMIEIQNLGTLADLVKAKKYLGAVDAEIEIIYKGSDKIMAKIKTCRESRYAHLPNYDDDLKVTVKGQLKKKSS